MSLCVCETHYKLKCCQKEKKAVLGHRVSSQEAVLIMFGLNLHYGSVGFAKCFYSWVWWGVCTRVEFSPLKAAVWPSWHSALLQCLHTAASDSYRILGRINELLVCSSISAVLASVLGFWISSGPCTHLTHISQYFNNLSEAPGHRSENSNSWSHFQKNLLSFIIFSQK